MGSAADLWRTELATWAIPDEIMAQAPADPWKLTPAMFTPADPAVVTHTAARRRALEALPPMGSVLDVGAGGGAAGLALVPPASTLVAVDESDEMLAALAATAGDRGIVPVTVHGRWPDVAPSVGTADVVVSHHVIYNVGDLGPFVRALTDHARHRVVLAFSERHPTSGANALWKHFWDIDRPLRPTSDDALAVLAEIGLDVSVERETQAPRLPPGDPVWTASLTRRLCLAPDRQPEVEAVLAELAELGEAAPRQVVTAWWAGSADA